MGPGFGFILFSKASACKVKEDRLTQLPRRTSGNTEGDGKLQAESSEASACTAREPKAIQLAWRTGEDTEEGDGGDE